MTEERETFCQWFARKRREKTRRLSQAEIASRASRLVPVSQTYVSLILRTAGTSDEPEVSPDRIIALAHALGENPSEAIALRANVIRSSALPVDEEIPLPGGGSILLRGRSGPDLSHGDRRQIAAVVDAILHAH